MNASSSSRRRLLAATVILLLPALYATPVTAATITLAAAGASAPSVVTAPDGTGHFAYQAAPVTPGTNIFDPGPISYCRARPGDTACSARVALPPFPGNVANSGPRIFRRASDGLLIVAEERCCTADVLGTWISTSGDGAHWTAARRLTAHANFTPTSVDMALSADGRHLDVYQTIDGSAGQDLFQRGPAPGSSLDDPAPVPESRGVVLGLGLEAAVAEDASGRPVVAGLQPAATDRLEVGVRRAVGDEVLTAPAWAPATVAADPGFGPDLATGGAATFVGDVRGERIRTGRRLEARALGAAGISGAAVTLSPASDEVAPSSTAIAAGPTGHLFGTWSVDLVDPRTSVRRSLLRYALAGHPAVSLDILRQLVGSPSMSANASDRGWIAWNGLDDSTRSALAVPFGPGSGLRGGRLSASPAVARAGRPRTLRFTVTQSSPACRAGVRIALGGRQVTTNAAGRGSLRVTLRRPGQVRPAVRAAAGCPAPIAGRIHVTR